MYLLIQLISISLKQGEVPARKFAISFREEDNEMNFHLSSRHGQIYINDAFGTARGSHASNVGIVPYLQNAGIGWLMDKELNYLQRIMSKAQDSADNNSWRAKIKKLELIDNFRKGNNIIIGGGMAFTFLKAEKKYWRSLLDKS